MTTLCDFFSRVCSHAITCVLMNTNSKTSKLTEHRKAAQSYDRGVLRPSCCLTRTGLCHFEGNQPLRYQRKGISNIWLSATYADLTHAHTNIYVCTTQCDSLFTQTHTNTNMYTPKDGRGTLGAIAPNFSLCNFVAHHHLLLPDRRISYSGTAAHLFSTWFHNNFISV